MSVQQHQRAGTGPAAHTEPQSSHLSWQCMDWELRKAAFINTKHWNSKGQEKEIIKTKSNDTRVAYRNSLHSSIVLWGKSTRNRIKCSPEEDISWQRQPDYPETTHQACPGKGHRWGTPWCQEKNNFQARLPTLSTHTSQVQPYLRMATVSASGELAQGQMTSGRRPLLWKTLRNASQEEIDPGVKEGAVIRQQKQRHQDHFIMWNAFAVRTQACMQSGSTGECWFSTSTVSVTVEGSISTHTTQEVKSAEFNPSFAHWPSTFW